MFGLFRVILWALVRLISSLCSAAEGIYNHIFSLVGVIYNDNVVRFLQGWMGFIWIPIAISVLYLGYSLIMGDATEGNMRAKTFARNVCLFVLIVVGVPYLFIGHADTDSASLFVNSNVSGYAPESSISNNSETIRVCWSSSRTIPVRVLSRASAVWREAQAITPPRRRC